jgi:hypothetical protein
MSNYAVMPISDYTNACDTLREKTGTTEPIKSGDLVSKIDDVRKAGEKNGLAMFWNGVSANGTRENYYYAFFYWDMCTGILNCPITIQPKSANYMFQRVAGGADLVEAEKNGGVKFDFSMCTSLDNTFRDSNFLKVGVVDGTSADALDTLFFCSLRTSSYIQWVEKLIVKETHTFSNTFRYNVALKHIIFEGTIGTSLDLKESSLLDVESAKSIINCLKNYSGTDSEYAYTVSLSGDVWTALNADSTPPSGNTWQDYVYSLGWNV